MKLKVLLFGLVLIVMFMLKHAFGQSPHESGGIGWDWQSCWDCGSYLRKTTAWMVPGPVLGLIIGVVRALRQNSAQPVLEPLRLRR